MIVLSGHNETTARPRGADVVGEGRVDSTPLHSAGENAALIFTLFSATNEGHYYYYAAAVGVGVGPWRGGEETTFLTLTKKTRRAKFYGSVDHYGRGRTRTEVDG